MIQFLYKPKISDGNCQILPHFKKGAWVHLEAPNEQELLDLAKDFKLDDSILLDVLDENEMPRVERDADDTYIFSRHAYTNDELRITTSPILFVLTKSTLFTISKQQFSRVDKFLSNKIEYSTTNHVELMLQIFDQLDDDYETKLNTLSRQIKSIRSRLRVENISNKDFVDFVIIEDVLNEFLSALSPTNSILRRLLLGRHITLKEKDKDLVEDLLLNNEQSVVGCKSSLKTIVNIREAYATIMTNNLNQVMRLLTIVTVIISVPTLVSSVYGMNIDLPIASSTHAFSIIMSFSLIISLLLVYLFKRGRWY